MPQKYHTIWDTSSESLRLKIDDAQNRQMLSISASKKKSMSVPSTRFEIIFRVYTCFGGLGQKDLRETFEKKKNSLKKTIRFSL